MHDNLAETAETPEAAVHQLVTLDRAQRYRGVRLVAASAQDAADCRELLDALGLDPADGRQPSSSPAVQRVPDRFIGRRQQSSTME